MGEEGWVTAVGPNLNFSLTLMPEARIARMKHAKTLPLTIGPFDARVLGLGAALLILRWNVSPNYRKLYIHKLR